MYYDQMYEIDVTSIKGIQNWTELLHYNFSFGNPNYDERSILAPLYQCCRYDISFL